ncbi:hypothetical protein JCGZ_25093 [Jatropha curcas]|uniref:Uncharacterized protein n=1 Tax=Jatropha curcas TaxID=180498 RepID=A0A067JYA3_JATCU|nr:uncharacterized protein LOC105646679 isoform X2 [Jatropha curcas]KDP24529.1 hypothetical protein JCGZ_25093 [Jatropha curcas]
MAESLDDGEFWLPPQILTDDDIFVDNKKNSDVDKSNLKSYKDFFGSETEFSKPFVPFDFPYGFGYFGVSSDLSSPVESVVGSTEESDEEDYMAGVTCRMARSTLDDDSRGKETNKGWFISGSPQSTLCGLGSGCGCRQGSRRGSPSDVSSPPATWDLLYAAAGEVARMRMNENVYGFNGHTRGILGPPGKSSPLVPLKNSNPEISVYPDQSFIYQKLQESQFQQLRQQQIMKQQSSVVWGGQTKGAVGFYQHQQTQNPVVHTRGRISSRPTAMGLSPSAWPSLQQAQQQQNQGGSAMRALFLGNPGGKRECAGTGVFLPRRVGAPAETRKKPACSTVLVPARVVQALNLNLDNSGDQHPVLPRFNGNVNSGHDNGLRTRNRSAAVPYQKFNLRPQQEINSEVRLPQEWTY